MKKVLKVIGIILLILLILIIAALAGAYIFINQKLKLQSNRTKNKIKSENYKSNQKNRFKYITKGKGGKRKRVF